MLGRLFAGLLVGALLGAVVAALAMRVLGAPVPAPMLAYALAVLTGAVTGLFAGKPFWAKGALIEVLLKAVFGALLAAGGLFAARTWLHVHVDLAALRAGSGELSQLAVTAFPAIGAVLGALFGLDNTSAPEADRAPDKGRVSSANGVRVAPSEEEESAEADTSRRSKR